MSYDVWDESAYIKTYLMKLYTIVLNKTILGLMFHISVLFDFFFFFYWQYFI